MFCSQRPDSARYYGCGSMHREVYANSMLRALHRSLLSLPLTASALASNQSKFT
jgi:hypothetical protein